MPVFYNNCNFKINSINNLVYFNEKTLILKPRVKLSSVFNTFKSEKNVKFFKIYVMMFYISNQRPFIRKIKFNFLKKKILKRFFLEISVSKDNIKNIMFFIVHFYFYFFHIYYQKNLKYNYNRDRFVVYLDNLQFFFKNYNKQNQKTQIKLDINFFDKNWFRQLNSMFLLRFRK